MKLTVFFFLFSVFILLVFPHSVSAYSTFMNASTAIGQPDFVSQTGGLTADKFSTNGGTGIRGVFVDPQGRLLVTDSGNSRVLIWNTIPTTNGKGADLVLGQDDFISGTANRGGSASSNTLSTPVSLWSDGTRLLVGDSGNNRVLMWNSFPTRNGQDADLVIGQTSMSATSTSCDATHTSDVYGIAVYNGKLILSNNTYNRVLIYNAFPTSNGATPDLVLGQTDYGTCTAGSISASTFSTPRGVFVDGNGKLYVADRSRNRVLIWNSFPTSVNQPSDVVVGQSTFINSGSATSQVGFNAPSTIFSTGNRLFVTDVGNGRVLIFNTIPTSNGAFADVVIGKADFTSNATSCSVSASCFKNNSSPIGTYVFGRKLLVGDGQASRILVFDDILSPPSLGISNLQGSAEGKITVSGSAKVGERTKYYLQSLKISVNGQGFWDVTHKDGGRDDGNGSLYDFYSEFEPWSGNGNQSSREDRGYSFTLKAMSSNGEVDQLFYFRPFQFLSIEETPLTTFRFMVNPRVWNSLRDTLESYEIYTKRSSDANWNLFLGNIPIFSEKYDESTGIVTVTTPTTLPGGTLDVKVSAKDKWGHRQDSNSLSYTSRSVSSYRPVLNLTLEWFPLQINSISTVTMPILSSFLAPSSSLRLVSHTAIPTVVGVAPKFSIVTLLVTDMNHPSSSRTYTASTHSSSSWKIQPKLYSSSIIDVWVTDSVKTSALPSFSLVTK